MIAPCASEYPVYSLNHHQMESAFKVIGAQIQSSGLHAVLQLYKDHQAFFSDETVMWLLIPRASWNRINNETSKLLILAKCYRKTPPPPGSLPQATQGATPAPPPVPHLRPPPVAAGDRPGGGGGRRLSRSRLRPRPRLSSPSPTPSSRTATSPRRSSPPPVSGAGSGLLLAGSVPPTAGSAVADAGVASAAAPSVCCRRPLLVGLGAPMCGGPILAVGRAARGFLGAPPWLAPRCLGWRGGSAAPPPLGAVGLRLSPPAPSRGVGGRGSVAPSPPLVVGWSACAALVGPGRRLCLAWRILLRVKTMSVLRTGDDGI